MLDALLTAILPIFAVPFAGFWLGRTGAVSQDAPQGINRFVLLVAVPALLFSLMAEAPVETFDRNALASYAGPEIVVYLTGFLLARFVFGRDPRESLLLGFAAAFTNHVFIVLPVATTLYGPEAGPPIAAIIAMDALIFFTLTAMLMELLAPAGGSPFAAAGRILRSPMLIGPALGLAVNLAGVAPHDGIMTYARFAGAAAAPAALFALGVTLGGADLRRIGAASVTVAALALVLHPLLTRAAWELLPPSGLAPLMVLCAAGPCGAMPYALASFHGVPVQSIAKAITVSSVVSVFTLAALA